jgi:hypothetical protein
MENDDDQHKVAFQSPHSSSRSSSRFNLSSPVVPTISNSNNIVSPNSAYSTRASSLLEEKIIEDLLKNSRANFILDHVTLSIDDIKENRL